MNMLDKLGLPIAASCLFRESGLGAVNGLFGYPAEILKAVVYFASVVGHLFLSYTLAHKRWNIRNS